MFLRFLHQHKSLSAAAVLVAGAACFVPWRKPTTATTPPPEWKISGEEVTRTLELLHGPQTWAEKSTALLLQPGEESEARLALESNLEYASGGWQPRVLPSAEEMPCFVATMPNGFTAGVVCQEINGIMAVHWASYWQSLRGGLAQFQQSNTMTQERFHVLLQELPSNTSSMLVVRLCDPFCDAAAFTCEVPSASKLGMQLRDAFGKATPSQVHTAVVQISHYVENHSGQRRIQLVALDCFGWPGVNEVPLLVPPPKASQAPPNLLASVEGPKFQTGTFPMNGQTANFVRLTAQGGLDPSFAPVTTTPVDSVEWVCAAPDGSVYVSGFFEAINGQKRHGLAKIRSNGVLDEGFAPVISHSAGAHVWKLRWDGPLGEVGKVPSVPHHPTQSLGWENPATGLMPGTPTEGFVRQGFANVDGVGLGMDVCWSPNMRQPNGATGPSLHGPDPTKHPAGINPARRSSGAIALRFGTDSPPGEVSPTPASLVFSFSEPVRLDWLLVDGVSVVAGGTRSEHCLVRAFEGPLATGAVVPPDSADNISGQADPILGESSDPASLGDSSGLALLKSADGGLVHLIGLKDQAADPAFPENGFYGKAMLKFSRPIRSFVVSTWVTERGSNPAAPLAVGSGSQILSFQLSRDLPQGRIENLAVDPSGHIIVSGIFDRINGVDVPQAARLTPEGEIDPTFAVESLPQALSSAIAATKPALREAMDHPVAWETLVQSVVAPVSTQGSASLTQSPTPIEPQAKAAQAD